MDGSALEEKSSFKMLGLTFSSKSDWGPYNISVAKTASKKIGALNLSIKFLSPQVALYLYKSAMWPCMEDCCHVWDGAPSCYLELLDKLQKRTCKNVGPSLATSLEPLLAHRRNAASLSLFYRHYFGRCSSELAQLVPLPFCRGRSTRCIAWFFCHHFYICLCQQFLSSHSYTLEFSSCKMLCSDLWSKWL